MLFTKSTHLPDIVSVSSWQELFFALIFLEINV